MAQASTLNERIAVTRRLPFVLADGESITAEVPTIEQLIKHAERYGTAQVIETAVELGYGLEPCVRLQNRLDIIAVEHHKRDNHGRTFAFSPPKPRGTAEDRVKKLLEWKEEEAPSEEDASTV